MVSFSLRNPREYHVLECCNHDGDPRRQTYSRDTYLNNHAEAKAKKSITGYIGLVLVTKRTGRKPTAIFLNGSQVYRRIEFKLS